ncbi:MAG TPA: lectin-like protein, partial [Polyangiaceae bacterium]|nr:lectin-like protein [Polyangiaceae bacterium]
ATPVNAGAAATACTAWGGELAEIDSAAEDALLGTRMTAPVWIGANDRVTEGTMVWSNGSPLQYANWAMGQPDNYLGAEDCVVKLSPAGTWNDTSCASLNAYVCERPAM